MDFRTIRYFILRVSRYLSKKSILSPFSNYTGEEKAFSKEQFKDLVDLAENGLKDLFTLQKEVIKNGWKTTKKNF